MKHGYLTVEEHRILGVELTTLRNDVAGADHLNLYKRDSPTAERLLRAQRMFDELRCKLDDELCKRHPTEASCSIYYSDLRSEQPLDHDLCLKRLRGIGDIINRKVPMHITDSYTRCDRALRSIVSAEVPEFDRYPQTSRRLSNRKHLHPAISLS
jgi:hypothetical protein